MDYKKMFDVMIENHASDLFIRAGSPLKARISTEVRTVGEDIINEEDIKGLLEGVLDDYNRKQLEEKKGCEFATWYGEQWRFRFGVFYQRNSICVVIRKIDLALPTFSDLHLPEDVLVKFCKERRGLILLTGITGSGKSTTIALMMDYINKNFGRHILTVEEPIEFTFKDEKAMINQRDLGKDVSTYQEALRQFALHSPDVIYIGVIRDTETCRAALTAAETGVLVLSTLHTVNASSTIERLVNFFPPHQHHLVLSQLSFLLKGVVTQRLVPRVDRDEMVPAYEIMTLSPSISRLLRENNLHELPKFIERGDIYGMKSFNQCLIELTKAKTISPLSALDYADKREEMELILRTEGLI